MNKGEQLIKNTVDKKVYDSAIDLLEKHDKADKILVNNEEEGKQRYYKKPVAEALLLHKRATKPKKYFFMKG